MIINNAAYKYEMPYNGQFEITQFWTDGTVTLQFGVIKVRHIICRIKIYTPGTNVEDINIENMYDDSQHIITRHIFLYYIKSWKQGM